VTEFIRQRTRSEVRYYTRMFDWRDGRGGGFSFPCDAEENLLRQTPGEHYEKCLDGTYDVVDRGVVSWVETYVEPAAIRCACGREVELGHFTNTCPCGRDYNWNGSLLATREQWGDETGETLAEILRID
jgi:hypothetical protein